MELVILTYGAHISRENEAFVISTEGGGRRRVSADGVTSLTLGRGTALTSDALFLAIERGIPVVLIERSGAPTGRVWSAAYGSISTIRKGQLAFSQGHAAVDWIREILTRKVGNQMAMMQMMSSTYRAAQEASANDSDVLTEVQRMEQTRDDGIRKLEKLNDKIANADGEKVADIAAQLRGWEGNASRIYFEVMNLFLPEEYRFEARSQHPALDPANAMLNYAYGILYARVEGGLILAGVDPYIGVLHRDEHNRPVLVYDVIEIFRVWADYVVFSLLGQKFICEDHYSVQPDGSVWLENLGRRIVTQSMNDYLEEVVDLDGLRRSRGTHINLYCTGLADRMRKLCDAKQ